MNRIPEGVNNKKHENILDRIDRELFTLKLIFSAVMVLVSLLPFSI